MRDPQLARFLETWSGFSRGVISSNKPNRQSTLLKILVLNPSEKYFLSKTACAGILRRAERRGKELPPVLRAALTATADTRDDEGKMTKT